METTETTDFALNLQDERSKIYFNWGFTKEKPERVITVGYFRGLVLGVGGDYFLSQFTPFKMHLSCVSCTTWTKRIYSDNLFIYKHCINCIFYCSYIYPWIDHVNPQYVYTVVFVTEDYFGGKDILYNFFTRNYTGFKVI